jgi:hypothetical protein
VPAAAAAEAAGASSTKRTASAVAAVAIVRARGPAAFVRTSTEAGVCHGRAVAAARGPFCLAAASPVTSGQDRQLIQARPFQ